MSFAPKHVARRATDVDTSPVPIALEPSTARLGAPRLRGRRAKSSSRKAPRRVIVAMAVVVAAAVAVPLAVSVASQSPGRERAASAALVAQSVEIPPTVVVETVSRDVPTATDQIATLSASATNADWAKLVLVLGKFPVTDNNVTVFLRWMRQENYTKSWWQRNNPLNNGWGSGGGGGLGSYVSLVSAAQNAADALHSNRGYSGIVASLQASSSPDATAAAIWASPWASSRYGNGRNWSTTEVPIVTAPASAWAR